MRPLKLGGLLAACLVLVGSACGSAPPARQVEAISAIPAVAHHGWRESDPTTTTSTSTTTSTTVPPTTAPPRVHVAASTQPAPMATGNYGGDCLHGWSDVSGSARTARAHACWDGLLAQYPWSTSKAFAVMMCESGGDPYNVGPPTRYGTAKGLMQVLPDGSFDPATNMAQAWDKYKARGWQPWVCA